MPSLPILLLLSSLLATTLAISDCYYPFLESNGGRASCASSSDCGSNSRCVFSLNLSRRICCSLKPGTVAPKCPGGDSSLPLVVCSSDDDCPGSSSCTPSATDFTRSPGSSSSICCT